MSSMSVVAAVMPAPFARSSCASFPSPTSSQAGMLLETMYSEVCGTDVHLWHGRLAGVPYPIIPGHVSVGRLAKVRGPITRRDGRQAREGDRVVFFDVHRTCGRCYACAVSGTPTKCVQRKVYGITDAAADGLFGGWSEAIYLEPGRGRGRAARQRDGRGLHRRRLRAHHRGARHRSRGDTTGRSRDGAGHRRRRAEHHRAGAAVWCLARSLPSVRRPIGSSWPGRWAPT